MTNEYIRSLYLLAWRFPCPCFVSCWLVYFCISCISSVLISFMSWLVLDSSLSIRDSILVNKKNTKPANKAKKAKILLPKNLSQSKPDSSNKTLSLIPCQSVSCPLVLLVGFDSKTAGKAIQTSKQSTNKYVSFVFMITASISWLVFLPAGLRLCILPALCL